MRRSWGVHTAPPHLPCFISRGYGACTPPAFEAPRRWAERGRMGAGGGQVTDQIRCGRRAASVSQGCTRWTQLSASVTGVGDSGRAGTGCCLPGDTETVRVGDRGNSPPSPDTDVSSACLPASLPYGTPQGSRSGGDRGGRVGEPWFFSSWCSFTARLPWVQIPSLQEIDLLWLYLHYKHLGSLGL